MCGRFLLRCPPESWPASLFDNLLDDDNLQASCVPRANIAPTQAVLAIVQESAQSPRTLRALRWGLVPSWTNDRKLAANMINARAETVHEKPSFRSAFSRRRCLIPADGYYEWIMLESGKQPMLFERPDQEVFCFAGLWERNVKLAADKDGIADAAHPLLTCTVITTAANQAISHWHDRMPVIIKPNDYSQWLDPSENDKAVVRELLVAAEDDFLKVRPVEKVGGV